MKYKDIKESEMAKLAKKAMETIDWKEFTKAYNEGQLEWHAREWKMFIEEIKRINTKRVKKEILESVNERIAKVVQKRIKVDKDGIGSWKINPDDIYFADNLKNDLKNITFFVEEELK